MSAANTLDFADADAVCAALGLAECPGAWRASWAASQNSFRPGRIEFLDPGFVREACRFLKTASEVESQMQRARALIRSRPALERLAWHGHHELFIAPKTPQKKTGNWPPLPGELGGGAGLVWALVFLSGVPFVRRLHRERGIPEAVTRDTLSDLELWIRECKRRHGAWGFRQLGWLENHFRCDLYKLGRLQFEFSRYGLDFHAFRHQRDRRVLLLAGDGMIFRADGQFADADGGAQRSTAWTAALEMNGRVIRGHPVSPRGFVKRTPVELDAALWKRIFGQGDKKLGTHIPATGPMDHAACGRSYAQALEFFPRHFPEWDFRAFTCSSWLLDPQFEDYLKPRSNIVRLLRELYLHPWPGAEDSGHFDRIFDGPVKDLDQAPQDTSLRRAIIRHGKAGKRWRSSGSLLFPEDLRWGEQVYRTMEAAGSPVPGP